ncbi:uncharacterized protein PHACADRAFT_204565 [Phanerochaete carnosa HHB-10118-sp]|uniref:Uncharacterized protein n=1 Tax=Phanerochaete carnosa (strain HHB-10118-sp) TaxID=650164 RepID=K5WPL6_PHACS|nr:uncharacterized protein PHACADRAFT_204565 [Phanerochaete carnosa HHB-10118-sp]EKM61395.1 hypothetical protein PHACADRAFT_204565 [Phanerochaete carnosa HHB-10118-sp]
MQSTMSATDDTILRPVPQTGNAVTEKTPGSPPLTVTGVAENDEAQGGFESAIPNEPSPHSSTKLEVLKLKDPAVKDFGWNSPPHAVPSPLVHGVPNDDLWVLIRRFNKQVFNVRVVDNVPGLLDMELSENEEFSPDKLRATLERFYMDVIVGVAAFFKHIARLRSWNEPRRTAWFALAYVIAWWFNILMPAFSVTLAVLIVDPPTRRLLFPPAPLSAISATPVL